jgi:hypothetical protein
MVFSRTAASIFILSLLVFKVSAQSGTQTPYSLVGLGDLTGGNQVHNNLVGGLGAAYGNPWNLNLRNPALLTLNSFTMFNVGISGDRRTIRSSNTSATNGGGDLEYLAFGIPFIANKWTTAFGLIPYSRVNYSVQSSQFLTEDSILVVQDFGGEGNLNSAFISTGYKLFDGFSLGATASFMFGPINQNATVLSSFDDLIGAGINERVSYSDFTFKAGAYYSYDLTENNFINIGITHEFATEIRGRQTREAIEIDPSSGVTLDTILLIDNQPVGAQLPSETAIGITYTKLNKWKVGIEYITRDWSNFVDINGNNDDLNSSHRIIIGGEFIPNFSATKGYLNRVTYLAGFSYANTQYFLNDDDVNEIGINFGFSFPVSRISSIETGLRYGIRGNVDKNLIAEEFFKFYLGISFNDIQWKKRPRFN